ncbi:UbiA prenyltransferase family protein [Echinicola sp. CAU 1574]|uniref:UbiA prenyltransferase family protein n=1 Tax=Echinicola arenosa TaxID=2774144 RepID=A0ABR9AKK4_9BACT|nr:UbiA family prenyltransferase [Echinicola arenosa]MBD8488435.1 UbiA prenyltransferase family protein [Echinicola arenosa]
MAHVLNKYYNYFQWLSLDVVLGACAGLFFFQHLLGISLTPVVYILMSLAVWGIYTFDHLMDARNIEGQASSARHLFHQENFNKLLVWLFLVGITGLYLAFNYIKFSRLITFGLLLGTMIVGNIMFLKFFGKKMTFLKELSTAAFYTAGITLVPLIRFPEGGLPKAFWFFAFGYFLMAWFNLLLLSYMDKDSDKKDNMNSIVNVLGEGLTKNLLSGLLYIGLAYILSLFFFLSSMYYLYALVLLIMFLIHALAFLRSKDNKEAVRRQIDAAYMLPFLLIFVF